MECRFAACPCQAWSSCRGSLISEVGMTSSASISSGGMISRGKVRGFGAMVGMSDDFHEGRRRFESSKEETHWVLNRRQVLLGSLLTSYPLFVTQGMVALADLTQELESSSSAETQESAEVDTFGFDGLGSREEEYAVGKVVALAQAGDGAVLFLGVDGFDLPLQMVVGAAEAMAILTAAQDRRSRRPVTHEAWGSSLAAVGWKVDHVTITTMESDVFYSRLVLALGKSLDKEAAEVSRNDRFRSVDTRPSDAIALALRCRAPLFINKKVAEEAVGALIKGADPVKRPSDPLNQPGLQAKSAIDTSSNNFLDRFASQAGSNREPLWRSSDNDSYNDIVHNFKPIHWKSRGTLKLYQSTLYV
uniref:BFN domain-containing protein n=1 Tax=Physcomitrium patens TaxID=3218 RepID=A0A7I4ECA2_PHYPA